MNTRTKQLTKLLIRILITTGLLLWVFSQIDLEQFRQTIKTARWHFLFAVWVLTVILFWIRSMKMKLILKKQSCDVATATIFGATAVTCLYSMILPGILSTGVKWYILKKGTGKGSNILSSMLYNQLSATVVLMVFGLAALMLTNPTSLSQANTENQWLLPGYNSNLFTIVEQTNRWENCQRHWYSAQALACKNTPERPGDTRPDCNLSSCRRRISPEDCFNYNNRYPHRRGYHIYPFRSWRKCNRTRGRIRLALCGYIYFGKNSNIGG